MKQKRNIDLTKALEQGAALPPSGDGQLLLAAGLVKFEHLPTWQGARGLERTFEALSPAISARTALVAVERGHVVACQLGSTRMRGMALQAVAASYMAGEAFLLHALQAHLDVAAAVKGPSVEEANAYTLEDYERIVSRLKNKDQHFDTVINADSLAAFELLRDDPERLNVVEALKGLGGLPLSPEELAEGGEARLDALRSLGFVIDGNEEALLERFDAMYPGEWFKFLHACLGLREPRDKTCIGHVLANLPSCP